MDLWEGGRMPSLNRAARGMWIPGWRNFLVKMWDEGMLYVAVDVSSPSPHPVQEMIMGYGTGQVASVVAFSTEFLPRLATEMNVTEKELEKKISVLGLRRRTDGTMTRFTFIMQAWNQNCWRLREGFSYKKPSSFEIVDVHVNTCPHTYNEFLAGAASVATISNEAAATVSMQPPPPCTPPPPPSPSTKRKAAAVEPNFESPPPPPPLPATTPRTKKQQVRYSKKDHDDFDHDHLVASFFA